jgi:hypothetical protein
MKRASLLCLSGLGFCGVMSWMAIATTRADNDNSVYTETDADGVPISVTHPELKPATDAQIAAQRRQLERAAWDKDWLMRAYQKQLQARAASGNDSNNLYFQLTSNKELARASGLPDLSSTKSAATPSDTVHSDFNSSTSATNKLPSGAPAETHLARPSYQPFISPLSSPEAAGLHNFYSSLPVTMLPPLSGTNPVAPAPSAVTAKEDPDSNAIETPGMLAAEKNKGADLTLDILPGETLQQAKAHQDNNSQLTPPSALTVDQLHKQQANSLSVAGPPRALPVTASTPPQVNKPIPIDDSDAPTPASKLTPISPVRSPISNPYDILNR